MVEEFNQIVPTRQDKGDYICDFGTFKAIFTMNKNPVLVYIRQAFDRPLPNWLNKIASVSVTNRFLATALVNRKEVKDFLQSLKEMNVGYSLSLSSRQNTKSDYSVSTKDDLVDILREKGLPSLLYVEEMPNENIVNIVNAILRWAVKKPERIRHMVLNLEKCSPADRVLINKYYDTWAKEAF